MVTFGFQELIMPYLTGKRPFFQYMTTVRCSARGLEFERRRPAPRMRRRFVNIINEGAIHRMSRLESTVGQGYILWTI